MTRTEERWLFEMAGGVLNVGYSSRDWRAKLLSNFAPTPFRLWGEDFTSVEGFWQGLKFEEGSPEQKRVFSLYAYEAKRAGKAASKKPGDTFRWKGKEYVVGSPEHQNLMLQALRAKFSQNPEAKKALLATRGLSLVHELPRDSKTIPGATFAAMLEQVREELSADTGGEAAVS